MTTRVGTLVLTRRGAKEQTPLRKWVSGVESRHGAGLADVGEKILVVRQVLYNMATQRSAVWVQRVRQTRRAVITLQRSVRKWLGRRFLSFVRVYNVWRTEETARAEDLRKLIRIAAQNRPSASSTTPNAATTGQPGGSSGGIRPRRLSIVGGETHQLSPEEVTLWAQLQSAQTLPDTMVRTILECYVAMRVLKGKKPPQLGSGGSGGGGSARGRFGGTNSPDTQSPASGASSPGVRKHRLVGVLTSLGGWDPALGRPRAKSSDALQTDSLGCTTPGTASPLSTPTTPDRASSMGHSLAGFCCPAEDGSGSATPASGKMPLCCPTVDELRAHAKRVESRAFKKKAASLLSQKQQVIEARKEAHRQEEVMENMGMRFHIASVVPPGASWRSVAEERMPDLLQAQQGSAGSFRGQPNQPLLSTALGQATNPVRIGKAPAAALPNDTTAPGPDPAVAGATPAAGVEKRVDRLTRPRCSSVTVPAVSAAVRGVGVAGVGSTGGAVPAMPVLRSGGGGGAVVSPVAAGGKKKGRGPPIGSRSRPLAMGTFETFLPSHDTDDPFDTAESSTVLLKALGKGTRKVERPHLLQSAASPTFLPADNRSG